VAAAAPVSSPFSALLYPPPQPPCSPLLSPLGFSQIRVRWSAKLWMRDPALGLTKMANGEPAVVHLDGVSNYHLDAEGKIYKHVIENIIMRGSEEAQPVQLALSWPKMGLTPELALPMPFGLRPLDAPNTWSPPEALKALFTADSESHAAQQPTAQQQPASPVHSRAAKPVKRRGGEPQASESYETPMQRAARERAEDAERAARLEELRAPEQESVTKRMGLTMPQACETSYDCERPDVCCDLLFGSVCCNGGLMIPSVDRQQGVLQRQAIPIPVDRDDGVPDGRGGGAPPNMPGGLQ
jgi:hypothetical protein